MNDIEKKKEAFLSLLKERATYWHVCWLWSSVAEWIEDNGVDENGTADIKVSVYDKGRDDELFDAMYEVENTLKCGMGTIDMKYRHEPKKIDGVVYVAMENPLDIHWKVDIGSISIDNDKQ